MLLENNNLTNDDLIHWHMYTVMDTGRFLNILNYKFQQISCQGAVGGLQ